MRSQRGRLLLSSALMLFVELALIRWAGSSIVYLSYFSNFVLLGSFLGIGLGFLRAEAKTDLFRWSPVALAFFVAFVRIFPVNIDRTGSELIFYGGHPSGLPIWMMLPLVFLAVAGVMMTIGQGVARAFSQFEPLEAYRLDILGSISGVVAFTVLSFLRLPPLGWGLVVAAVFLVLLPPRLGMVQGAALGALVLLLLLESLNPNDSWSPYYKITAFHPAQMPAALAINVNGIPHQTMVSGDLRRKLGAGATPFEVSPGTPRSVLIIGAGNGVDVASALEHGVQHVDAVEIDPRIYDLGKSRNPDKPYQDPRVHAIIDDGRAVLERTHKSYDMIVFALPDSLSLVSGQSSLRLESYLFTIEALQAAQRHLAPGGTFAMYNTYRESWLVDRMAGTVEDAFGTKPCVIRQPGTANFATIAVATPPTTLSCTPWNPTGAVVKPATDDAPFPYLRSRTIPAFYLITLALVLLASVLLVRVAAGPLRSMVPFLDLFLMGSAFLLLETKNIVQFALLFGTTWLVNAFVFVGVLVAVYLAVELSRRIRIRRPALLYAALLASLVVAYLVPSRALLQLDPPVRLVAAIALAFAPIFFANVVFAQRFRDVSNSINAFGANLLGAVLGGLLEYSALIVGYRALLIGVGLLYGAAFLLGRRAWTRVPVPIG